MLAVAPGAVIHTAPLLVAASHCAFATHPLCRTTRTRHTPAPRLQADDQPPLEPLTPLTPLTPAADDTSSWTDVAIGAFLFVLLQSVFLSLASVAGLSAAQDGGVAAASRLLATGSFFAVQQVAGLPASTWLSGGDEARGGTSGSSPVNDFLRSPAAPPAAALAFAVAVAATLQLLGIEWLPEARPLPDAGRALDVLVMAPLTEEAFFRAWLLSALDRLRFPTAASLAASATLFSLWHLPSLLNGSASGGVGELAFYAALGAWLALLYRQSDRSLPLVAGTHASFNLIVVLLRTVRS